MEHQILVATEIKKAGFVTELFANGIIVKLTNRKVSKMEVETALNQIFDEIQFDLQSLSTGVFIKL